MKTVKALAVIAVVWILAVIARYYWIEPAAIGDLCRGAEASSLNCTLRSALIMTFAFNGLGYASLVLGLGALCLRRTGLAVMAGAIGAAGLVLYCYELAAVGFLLSVLTLARETSAPRRDETGSEHGEREQQA